MTYHWWSSYIFWFFHVGVSWYSYIYDGRVSVLCRSTVFMWSPAQYPSIFPYLKVPVHFHIFRFCYCFCDVPPWFFGCIYSIFLTHIFLWTAAAIAMYCLVYSFTNNLGQAVSMCVTVLYVVLYILRAECVQDSGLVVLSIQSLLLCCCDEWVYSVLF